MPRLDVAIGSRLRKNAFYGLAGPIRWPVQPVLGPDRFHQSANAQNAHHPFHVVGQDMQRHLGADVLERFHVEVRRSPSKTLSCRRDARQSGGVRAFYPGFDRAAPARSQGRIRAPSVRSGALCLLCIALHRARLTGGRPIAAQCLAVLFIGIAIGQLLTGRTKIDFVRADGSKGELTAHTRLDVNRRRQPHI